MKLSDYVFEFLKSKNVRHVFMLPGGGAMHLVDSLGKSGIEYIPFLHEQGASIAAEAYGQHMNTPGVCLVTSGPGGTNVITAVTAGWIDSTPMLIISGQAKRSDLVGDKGVRQIGSQEVQIIPMVKPVTKYAVQVLEPERIRYHLEKAWHEATAGRPGPVWLDIPLDVQGCMVDENGLRGYEVTEYDYRKCWLPGHTGKASVADSSDGVVTYEGRKAAEMATRRTAELLSVAKKPLILIGNGVKLSGEKTVRSLYRLLDRFRIPVQTTWKTIDLLAEDNPLYVGHPGIMGDRGANLILQEADFLLSIGSRMDTSITAFNEPHFAFHAKKVIVDIDENELERMQIPDATKVCCDAGEFLSELSNAVDGMAEVMGIGNPADAPAGDGTEIPASGQQGRWGGWLKHCRTVRKSHPVVTERHREKESTVSCYYFIDRLCDLLRDDDVIVPESSGGAGEITYQAFRLKKGQKMKNAAGLGSMGFGLPYAIGSCIANDRRRTVLINGDGAFQLNIQELETAHRLGLPLKIFVWCNGGYASIRSMQRNNFGGRYVGSSADSGHTMPDIGAIAEAYGFRTEKIRDNRELEKKLPELLEDDEPLLCEVMVNPEETVSPRVKAYVGENGEMKSGLLERMWPDY